MEVAQCKADLFEIAINLEAGDFDQGFTPVTVTINYLSQQGDDNSPLSFDLPPCPQLDSLYRTWQKEYLDLVDPQRSRGHFESRRRNISTPCDRAYRNLNRRLNQWLEPIKQELETRLSLNQAKKIILEIRTLKGHYESVWSISFSPDGKTLASSSGNKTIKLWNFELDSLMGGSCDWVRYYLQNNPNVSESDRHLCDGIGTKN